MNELHHISNMSIVIRIPIPMNVWWYYKCIFCSSSSSLSVRFFEEKKNTHVISKTLDGICYRKRNFVLLLIPIKLIVQTCNLTLKFCLCWTHSDQILCTYSVERMWERKSVHFVNYVVMLLIWERERERKHPLGETMEKNTHIDNDSKRK